MEEYAPKESGKDALRDKRKGVAYNIHAAAKEKEENRVYDDIHACCCFYANQ
jgi:hypothetical protein